jgi:hypothetical protein
MVESKTQNPHQGAIVEKVTKWIGSPAFFDAVQRHMTIGSTFSIEALSLFERDPILRTLLVARGYAKLGGKVLPLTVTISHTDITVRVGLIKIVIPEEEVSME